MSRSKIATCVLTSVIILLSSQSAFALTTGFSGVNDYSGGWFDPNCKYGDRAGATYAQNLKVALTDSRLTNSWVYVNNSAWETDIHTNGPADRVGFFAFAGHGLRYNYWPNLNDNGSAHMYSANGNPNYHDSDQEGNDNVNATWDEARLGHGYTKFASFYSCNWLTNGGSDARADKIGRMFEGIHLMTGFASIMYLDSREATTYGRYLNNGNSIKYSWFQSAREWQTQSDTNVIARVTGATRLELDSLFSYGSDPGYYRDYPTGYTSWTTTVTGTGIHK